LICATESGEAALNRECHNADRTLRSFSREHYALRGTIPSFAECKPVAASGIVAGGVRIHDRGIVMRLALKRQLVD